MSALVHEPWARESRETLRALLFLGALAFVLLAIKYFLTLEWRDPIPRDGSSLVVGRDFLNMWMYGRTALTADPSRFYDPQLYNAELQAMLGGDYPGQNWSYPPSIMLLAAPFGRLPYLPALVAWLLLTMSILVWTARRHLPETRLLVALIVSPAAVFCLMSGQSSFLTTAIIIAIFASLDSRPVLAGLLIGLLTLKPQVGALLPVLLVASGRWKAFTVAALTAISIAALTAGLFGMQVWIDFLRKGVPVQNIVLADPRLIAAPFMPTIFMNVHAAGAGYAFAMAVQVAFSLFAVGAVFWAYHFRRDADPQMLMTLFLACSVFGAPYLLSYDVLPLTFAALILLASGRLDPIGCRLAMLVYWLPIIQMGFGYFHIPGPALIAPAIAIYLLLRLRALPAGSRALQENRQ